MLLIQLGLTALIALCSVGALVIAYKHYRYIVAENKDAAPSSEEDK